MIRLVALAAAGLLLTAGATSGASSDVEQRLMQLAQTYSCSPRRTCGEIGSCSEATWLLRNCSWGGKLDRDGDESRL